MERLPEWHQQCAVDGAGATIGTTRREYLYLELSAAAGMFARAVYTVNKLPLETGSGQSAGWRWLPLIYPIDID